MNKIFVKKFAFNFVELMLVMTLLGIIAALTFPTLKKLKDDDKIYRAYMKKAIQDVSDASIMALMRNKYLTSYDRLGDLITGIPGGNNASYTADSQGLRFAFNTVINGQECGSCTDPENCPNPCLSNNFSDDDDTPATEPGIKYGKTVMLFEHSPDVNNIPKRIGYVYVDMNGNKQPNTLCKDRYRFILYPDRAVLDSTSGCSL